MKLTVYFLKWITTFYANCKIRWQNPHKKQWVEVIETNRHRNFLLLLLKNSDMIHNICDTELRLNHVYYEIHNCVAREQFKLIRRYRLYHFGWFYQGQKRVQEYLKYICTSNFHTMESIQTKFGNRNLVRMLFLINHSNLNWQQILHSKLEKNETKYSEQERHFVQISISKNGVYSSTNRTHPSSYKPPRPFSSFGPRRFFSSDRVRTQLCRWKLRVHPILVVAK